VHHIGILTSGGLLKFQGFRVEVYCNFCFKMPQKASKRGLLGKNNIGLFEFGNSGGLIKSGGLHASIRYFALYL